MIDMLRAKILDCYLKFDSEVVLRRKFSLVFILSILFLLLVLKFAISDYGPGFDDPGGECEERQLFFVLKVFMYVCNG